MVFIMLSKLKSHHQILIAMVLGYIIGYSFDFSKIFIPLGDIFIRLLKMIIVPIIFTSIVSGVSSVSKSQNIRVLGLKTILYYMSTSLIAIILGLFLTNTIKPGVGFSINSNSIQAKQLLETPAGILDMIYRIIPLNPIESLANGDMLSYSWMLTNVPTSSIATLSDSTSSSPKFTADLDGTYEATLIVNDGSEDSAVNTVMITAETANSAPTANAGIDQNITTTTVVTLDGSASADADGDTLSYIWALTSAPSGSSAVLIDSTVVAPTFTADLDGSYIAQLTVNDGVASSAPDTITIVAETLNSVPIASAGTSQNVATGDVVALDGSGSSDADGDALSYTWSFSSIPSGSLAIFDDSTSASPSFTADLAGSYVAGLIVSDGTEDSASATVSIEATSPVIRLYTRDSLFGDSEVSWPYSSSGTVVASISGSTTYTLDKFRLEAIGQNFTITNLVATDLSYTVSPVFVGLANGDVIIDGTEVDFSLVSPLTGGVTTNLSYKFEILETGQTFEYTSSLRTN